MTTPLSKPAGHTLIIMAALGPSLREQCESRGLVATGKGIDVSERFADAVTLCNLHCILTDSEANKARRRILSAMRLRQIRSEAA